MAPQGTAYGLPGKLTSAFAGDTISVMDATFHRFGGGHLAALAVTLVLPWLLVKVQQCWPHARASIRYGLACPLLIVEVGWFLALLFHFQVGLKWALPLQLSDASILLTVLLIFTLWQRLFDVVYYWGLTAVPLAMLMPDLPDPFPDPYTIVFFVVHGLVVVTLVYLVGSRTLRPSPGSALRSFLMLNAFMLCVLATNAVLGTNYMYLMQKPSQPSLLDFFGPWPWYILTSEFVALGLFCLLELPFRTWRRAARGAESSDGVQGS